MKKINIMKRGSNKKGEKREEREKERNIIRMKKMKVHLHFESEKRG